MPMINPNDPNMMRLLADLMTKTTADGAFRPFMTESAFKASLLSTTAHCRPPRVIVVRRPTPASQQ